MEHGALLGAGAAAAKAKEGARPIPTGPLAPGRSQKRRVTPTDTIREEWIGLEMPPWGRVA